MNKIKLITASLLTSLVIITLTIGNGIKANTIGLKIMDLTAGNEVTSYGPIENGEVLTYLIEDAGFGNWGLLTGNNDNYFIPNNNYKFILPTGYVLRITELTTGYEVTQNGVIEDGVVLQFVFEDDGFGVDMGLFSGDQDYYFKQNNQFRFDIIQAELDTKRPAISGQENFVTSVDDAKPVSFFQSFLTAIDETDGEVPVYVISDNYTANIRVLGTHKVVFGAKDNSGNEATLEAYIRVVDITKPIINGNDSVVKIGYKETWNITNFKTTLTVSDNYDTLTNADITVKSDDYTANKSKLGTYNVVFAVKDSSNNEGTFTKPVQVYDNVRPTFSGPTNIATSNTTILTESDVRAQITANDEIDGNLTNKIKLVEDNFTGKGNKVGSYTIKYSVTDNAGNTAEFIVTIQRSDKLPPVIWIQDGVSIKTTPTTPLTFEQIISILQSTGQVSGSTQTRFSLIYDEYTGNESTPGIYAMSINARSVDGNESLHNMSITVLDDSNDDGITTNPGFEIVTWIKENPALVTVGIVAVIGIGYFVFRKKK